MTPKEVAQFYVDEIEKITKKPSKPGDHSVLYLPTIKRIAEFAIDAAYMFAIVYSTGMISNYNEDKNNIEEVKREFKNQRDKVMKELWNL